MVYKNNFMIELFHNYKLKNTNKLLMNIKNNTIGRTLKLLKDIELIKKESI